MFRLLTSFCQSGNLGEVSVENDPQQEHFIYEEGKENENFEAKDLFKYYHDFVKVIGVTILMSLIVMLGYICFIIPGIILTLSYSLVPIILIKKPELGIVETLKYSREKMQGHKLDTFVLGLSFIGWAILGTLTFGILYIWLYPYMQLTFTKFYLNILGEN